jgi:hypothetical protein
MVRLGSSSGRRGGKRIVLIRGLGREGRLEIQKRDGCESFAGLMKGAQERHPRNASPIIHDEA